MAFIEVELGRPTQSLDDLDNGSPGVLTLSDHVGIPPNGG